MIRYLLGEVDEKYKIDPAAGDNDVIRGAASRGHLHVVKYLMEKVDEKNGIDPAAGDNHAIRWSACAGHLPVVEYLMIEVDEKMALIQQLEIISPFEWLHHVGN